MPLKRVRAKKALGQHFLTDPLIAERIADTIPECYRTIPVLEIGPGMGILTQSLAERCPDLYLLEIDPESIDYLRVAGKSIVISGSFERHTRQEYEALIEAHGGKRTSSVTGKTGNYPYNISGRLFFKLYEWHHRVPCCTGMLQKEVAERLTAAPGSRTYGILSVL